MKCYICRTQLGEGHQPTVMAVGLGDETKERGGFLLCGKCTSALVGAWVIIHEIALHATDHPKSKDGQHQTTQRPTV
jgi:hypothetical protein